MSWLRNHLRHFVLPGIYALAHSRGKPITALDIKPRDKEVRPSTDCKFVEAGMLYAVVSSILRKGDPTREIALGLCRQVGQAKDAEFVYAIDKRGGIKTLGAGYDGVEGSDVLHSMLCNSMRRLKRKMRRSGQLLLPGRDVWPWEVMARKLAVDSTYDPRVSRSVACNQIAIKTCIEDWKVQNWQDILFFDTGFSGSIPRAIAGAVGLKTINMVLLSSVDPKTQIFRTHTGSRAKALAFEYLCKYFQSGTTQDGKPYQALVDLDEFIKAALLTIWLWHHVSPTKLPSYREKKLSTKGGLTIGGIQVKPLPTVPIGMNPNYFGKVTISGGLDTVGTTDHFSEIWAADTTSVTSTPQFVVNTNWSSATTGSSLNVNALQTLDHMWGANASNQLLVDSGFADMYHGVPKGTIKSGQADKSGTKKIQALAINPKTFELVDANTGQSVENQMDAKALAVAKGKAEPVKEGFGVGEYPGPPVVSGNALKTLAGIPYNGPLPEVNMGVEVDTSGVSGKPGMVFKKISLKAPDGTEKIYMTPLTG